WSEAFDVTVAAMQVSIKIPDLLAETGAPASPSPATPAEKRSQAAAQRAIGIRVGVVGVLGVTAGTIFGLRAKSIWADAKARCATYPNVCDQSAINLGQDA